MRRQGFVLLLVAVLTALAGFQIIRSPLDNSLLHAFTVDHAEYERFLEKSRQLEGKTEDRIFLATVEGDALFSARVLNAIRATAQAMEQLPEIAEVSHLADATRLSAHVMPTGAVRYYARKLLAEGKLNVSKIPQPRTRYWPESEKQQRAIDFDALRKDMLADQTVRGHLLSPTATAQIMVIVLKSPDNLSAQEQMQLKHRLEAIALDHKLGGGGLHFAGFVISQAWFFEELVHNAILLFPIVVCLVCLIVYLLFRRVVIVFITGIVCLLATIWAVGTTSLVFSQLSVMVVAAPIVIVVVSTSDVIHLVVAYRYELNRGLAQQEALRCVMNRVGGACLLTSLTTLVGFVSLMTVPVLAMKQFAFAAALGVASALFIAMTFVPIVCSWSRPLEPKANGMNQFVSWIVAQCRWVSLDHPYKVVVVSVILIAGSLIFVRQIEFSADFTMRFPADHPYRQGINFFNNELEGSSTVEILLSGPERSIPTREVTQALYTVESQAKNVPQVASVQSILALYRTVDQLIGFQTPSGLPASRVAAENSLELIEHSNLSATASLVSSKRDLSRMVVLMSTTDLLELHLGAERLRQAIGDEFPKSVNVEVSGVAAIMGRAIDAIIEANLRGLGLCALAILLIMAMGLRSIRLSLIAQIPNMWPLLLLGSALVLTRDRVDTDMLILPMIALGLAVDDTIHFLHRYRLERTNCADRRAALENVFHYSGPAIIQTTLILCIGLSVCAFSAYAGVWMLGTYLIFALGCAVVADLFLLPALVMLGAVDSQFNSKPTGGDRIFNGIIE